MTSLTAAQLNLSIQTAIRLADDGYHALAVIHLLSIAEVGNQAHHEQTALALELAARYLDQLGQDLLARRTRNLGRDGEPVPGDASGSPDDLAKPR